MLTRAGSPLAPVGHSYGAAIALIAALAEPGPCTCKALSEPTLFALLDAETPAPNEAEGIRNVVAEAGVALDAGNQDAAAERFMCAIPMLYTCGSSTLTRPEANLVSFAVTAGGPD